MVHAIENLVEASKDGKLLRGNEIFQICQIVKSILLSESNVLRLSSPIKICGDVHGQFHDLRELFKQNGCLTEEPSAKYLFLGDYVDRGAMSVETIMHLLCLKAKYPHRLSLLRGNHESRQITKVYGFYLECQKKYPQEHTRVYNAICDVFDCLPLAAVVDEEHLALHGGLSPLVQCVDQLTLIDRFQEIPTEGPYSDIVWSDPDTKHEGFHVSPRGAGYIFGHDIVEHFLHTNKLKHISRAHQLCMEGYQILFRGTLSTIWSAPNYCYRFGNLASVMALDSNDRVRINKL